nr:CDP-diacylglycerol--serine O-phosphatidyltransferase [Nitrospirota bacterium]
MKDNKPVAKESKRKRAVYLIPNLLTTGNLFSGLFAILAVFEEHY